MHALEKLLFLADMVRRYSSVNRRKTVGVCFVEGQLGKKTAQ
jgi:hypothetical protein